MDYEIKQKFPEKRNREYCKYNVSIADDKGLVQRIKVFFIIKSCCYVNTR